MKGHGSVTIKKNLVDGSKISVQVYGRCSYEYEPRSGIYESAEVLEIEEAEIECVKPHDDAEVIDGDWVGSGGGFHDFGLKSEVAIADFLRECWGIDIYDQSWELDPDEGPDGPDPDDARDAILERD